MKAKIIKLLIFTTLVASANFTQVSTPSSEPKDRFPKW